MNSIESAAELAKVISTSFETGCCSSTQKSQTHTVKSLEKKRKQTNRERTVQERKNKVLSFIEKNCHSAMHSRFFQKTMQEAKRRALLSPNPAVLADSLTARVEFDSAKGKHYCEVLPYNTCIDNTGVLQALSMAYSNEKVQEYAQLFNVIREVFDAHFEEWNVFASRDSVRLKSDGALEINTPTVVSTAVGKKCDIRVIDVPSGLKVIGSKAFDSCTRLCTIFLPGTIETIDSCAFRWCLSLRSVSIPSSVKTLGAKAFDGSISMRSIAIPPSVTSIGNHIFRLCTSLVSVCLPALLTFVPEGAFQYCVSLTQVVIPNSVQHIGPDSFGYCISLANIWLPVGITTIGNRAFRACNSFSKVTLPHTVTTFGKDMFIDCNLQEAPLIRPASPRYFVIWALGQSRRRANWRLTTIRNLRNVLRLIACYTIVKKVVPNGESKQVEKTILPGKSMPFKRSRETFEEFSDSGNESSPPPPDSPPKKISDYMAELRLHRKRGPFVHMPGMTMERFNSMCFRERAGNKYRCPKTLAFRCDMTKFNTYHHSVSSRYHETVSIREMTWERLVHLIAVNRSMHFLHPGMYYLLWHKRCVFLLLCCIPGHLPKCLRMRILVDFLHPYPFGADINWGLKELFGERYISLEPDSDGKRVAFWKTADYGGTITKEPCNQRQCVPRRDYYCINGDRNIAVGNNGLTLKEREELVHATKYIRIHERISIELDDIIEDLFDKSNPTLDF